MQSKTLKLEAGAMVMYILLYPSRSRNTIPGLIFPTVTTAATTRSPEVLKAKPRSKLRPRINTKRTPPGTLKDYEFPPDFCLVIDTREQTPLFHPLPKGLIVTRDTLHNGDYSVRGLEDQVCVERKGVSDFFSYITSERARTKEKLLRLREYRWKALVVEEDEANLLGPQLFTATSPEVVRQSLVSFRVKYGLHVYCSSDRAAVERFVIDHLIYYHKLARMI